MISSACKTKCDMADTSWLVKMADPLQTGAGVDDPGTLQTEMCKDEVTTQLACMRANTAECSTALAAGSMKYVTATIDCFCSVEDGCSAALAPFVDLAAAIGDGGSTPTATIKAMCPLVPTMACLATKTKCETVNGILKPALKSIGNENTGVATMKAMCAMSVDQQTQLINIIQGLAPQMNKALTNLRDDMTPEQKAQLDTLLKSGAGDVSDAALADLTMALGQKCGQDSTCVGGCVTQMEEEDGNMVTCENIRKFVAPGGCAADGVCKDCVRQTAVTHMCGEEKEEAEEPAAGMGTCAGAMPALGLLLVMHVAHLRRVE